MSDVLERITNYLGNGGVFNPELMEHDKVRDLLIDCRDELKDKALSLDVITLRSAITALIEELKAERFAVDFYANNFETRGSPEWYLHDVISLEDKEILDMSNLNIRIHKGGKLARQTQANRKVQLE